VVIGPEWIGARGASRLADPDDFVRLEVETALRAADVTVIPVLVGNARMPAPEQLPPPLRPLARRNAIELTDLRWRYDCQRLMAALDDLLGEPARAAAAGAAAPAVVPAAAPRASSLASVRALIPLWLEGVAIAVIAGMLARWAAAPIQPHPPPGHQAGSTELILMQIARRAVVWAAVGAALALWLSLRRGDQGRLLRRLLIGLTYGALAGALGGALFALPDHFPSDGQLRLFNVASLAITGGLLGMGLGALWIPPRTAAGLLAGACGGALAQVCINVFVEPSNVEETRRQAFEVGYQCLGIFGLALLALLALDVLRAASAPRAAPAAPEAARA
jgi:hypothetical protein